MRRAAVEPFEVARIEDDAGRIAIAPFDQPLASRDEHYAALASRSMSRPVSLSRVIPG